MLATAWRASSVRSAQIYWLHPRRIPCRARNWWRGLPSRGRRRAYLPQSDLGKLKTIFWRNNIVGFAPFLDVPVEIVPGGSSETASEKLRRDIAGDIAGGTLRETLIGTWYSHSVDVPDGSKYSTGVSATDPWWHVDGRWFGDGSQECLIGAGLARRLGLHVGDTVAVRAEDRAHTLTVTGIVSTGGREDNAILAPLEVAQDLAGRPGRYRTLLVSALTKPADAFSERDPATLTPVEYDRWYCSPYISSISHQMQQELPGIEVRAIRQVAEGEGQILTRVGSLMWLVTLAALFAAALAVGATSGNNRSRAPLGNELDEGAGREAIARSAHFFLPSNCSWRWPAASWATADWPGTGAFSWVLAFSALLPMYD